MAQSDLDLAKKAIRAYYDLIIGENWTKEQFAAKLKIFEWLMKDIREEEAMTASASGASAQAHAARYIGLSQQMIRRVSYELLSEKKKTPG